MIIELDICDIEVAKTIANLRQEESKKKGLKNNHGFNPSEEEDRQKNINGAAAELAVAKWLNIYFVGSVNTFKEIPDVGRFEIRHTELDNGSLIVRKPDPDDRRYILVTGKLPKLNIRGWLLGADAKKTQWCRDYGGRPPAWFVPQNGLKSLDKLKA